MSLSDVFLSNAAVSKKWVVGCVVGVVGGLVMVLNAFFPYVSWHVGINIAKGCQR